MRNLLPHRGRGTLRASLRTLSEKQATFLASRRESHYELIMNVSTLVKSRVRIVLTNG